MRQDISGETVAVHLSALGVPVVLRASGDRSADLARAFESAWEWCLDGPPGEHSDADSVVIEAFLDKDGEAVRIAQGQGLTASTSTEELMHWLTPLVTTRAITSRASSLLMMHACVVSDPVSGASVVLIGPSGAGKTTLARTLGTEFGYVTDECAALRDDHTIVPFPKPLSLVTGDAAGIKEQVSPAALGLRRPHAIPRAVAVLYLDRRADAPASPALTAARNVQALGLLCPQVSFVGARPEPLKRIVSLLDACGGLQTVSYREAADLVEIVGGLMEDSSSTTVPTRQGGAS
ncbi:MAG TPA: hypothetical protein VLB29_11220 [Nocardioidaceae bacterium]|nr:hypothetical protein [Nocardioidaceae bacterium]